MFGTAECLKGLHVDIDTYEACQIPLFNLWCISKAWNKSLHYKSDTQWFEFISYYICNIMFCCNKRGNNINKYILNYIALTS